MLLNDLTTWVDDSGAEFGAAAAAAAYGYDVVLVDAPCSSTGALRRFPSLRWKLDESKVSATAAAAEEELPEDAILASAMESEFKVGWDGVDSFDGDSIASDGSSPNGNSTGQHTSFQSLQRDILGRAATLVRPDGGALVYATCSAGRCKSTPA